MNSAALSLGDQSSSGSTLGAVSAPAPFPAPIDPVPREAPPSDSPVGA
jgi:hypothetical protein